MTYIERNIAVTITEALSEMSVVVVTGMRQTGKSTFLQNQPVGDKYFGRWTSKWKTISAIKGFFDKITEEIIDPDDLIKRDDVFLEMLGKSYKAYKTKLFDNNKVDFAFQHWKKFQGQVLQYNMK